MKNVILVAAVALSAYVASPLDCDDTGKCAPGFTCVHGTCVLRADCPLLSIPRLKAGCKLEMEVDERDCPVMKTVCENENLKWCRSQMMSFASNRPLVGC
ncbi:hypothetical protein Y032_0027g1608 [Ancylostoma ceylanicum]|uniref:Follistatin-like domain-containing protein n=1 Tax=Ancylostoma ceylanicum TaxID=53326 RepID=A0A016UUZ2_9BILA|nr:hypothetical protein Y032_0027g1608 [Ancylostoma ceylanicum]